MVERQLRFAGEDMKLFAAGSGDHSPLHMDPSFARRTSFGQCIVFGGLETLGMLGTIPPESLSRVRSVRSQFPAPVLLDEPLTAVARSRPDRPDEWEVRLIGRGKLLARVVASADAEPPAVPGRSGQREIAWAKARHTPDKIDGDYRPGPELAELARRFGAQPLHSGLREGIAWASQVVGMSIPGFDGLCAAVNVVTAPEAGGTGAHQQLRLLEYDERTDRLLIDGVLSDADGVPRCLGLIECFPFGPTPLPESAALSGPGRSEAPKGAVVVVGGSRGIGAALTLAMLERGYALHVLYERSEESIAQLTALAGARAGHLTVHRLDAADGAAIVQVAETIGDGLHGLALCAAPPPLPMGLSADAVPAIAEYVAATVGLTAAPLAGFLPRLRRRGGWVMFLSSANVMDPPRETPQWGAAKSAVEGLARWVARTTPSARVVIARPPRTRTDLVNTPAARVSAAPAELVAGMLAEHLLTVDLPPGLEIVAPELKEVSAG